MKNLTEYVRESFDVKIEESSDEPKSFTLDFTDLENAEETINSLKDNEAIEIEDKKVTITVTKDSKDVERAMEVLRQYTEMIRSSSRRASDEKYAQKTVSFAKVISEIDDYISELDAKDDEEKKKEEE